MASSTDGEQASRVTLLCFDGSEGATEAIAASGKLLGGGPAVVLTVWEPLATWEPYDPVTVLGAPVSKAASKALNLDEIAQEVADERMKQGLALASAAGFTARGQAAHGKAWRTICDVGDEIDAAAIVLGARGLSRVESMLLGSVSLAVAVHARRPVLIVPPSEG